MAGQTSETQAAAGRPDHGAILARLESSVAAKPGDGPAWLNLARGYRQAGATDKALDAFERARQAGLPEITLAYEHALALTDLGRHAEAEALLTRVLEGRKPDFKYAMLCGVVVKRAGRPADAIKHFELARKLDPKNYGPLINLGNTYLQLDEPLKALDVYGKALRVAPKNAENWRLHSRAQMVLGQFDDAIRSLKRSHLLDARNIDTIADLVNALIERKLFDEALATLAKARRSHPTDMRVRVIEARLLRNLGRTEESRARLDEILADDPDQVDALFIMARLVQGADRRAANGFLRRAVAAQPDSLTLTGALCDSLNRSSGEGEAESIEEAYAIACRLLDSGRRLSPVETKILRGVFARCVDLGRFDGMGSLSDLAPGWIARDNIAALHLELGRARDLDERIKLVEWHRQWGRQVIGRVKRVTPAAAPAILGQRKIRIGFMSSDLRAHPVTYFAYPLLAQFDRDRFEVYCYSFYTRGRDKMQERIEQDVTAFRWWPGKPDAEVAQGIAEDGLDILFELGGSTDMNKLDVMAYKPARIGASWLGYPHSAGLETIDYLLVDPYLKPADPRLMIEQPFEMPETWVIVEPPGFPSLPVEPSLPEERHGRVTFGTMNNPYKYTAAMLDAWARVMRAVPDSRFLFVRPEGGVEAFRRNIEAEFARRDVAPDRIAYVGVRGKHMPHYNDIDVALDTFPHVGGTTTCETLWMGVPVVTLVGPAFFERLSYSNLSNAGLGDLCTFSADDYVAKAVEIAGDRARRRRLRTGLRDMIRAHPLGQAGRFVSNFYTLVEKVVRQ